MKIKMRFLAISSLFAISASWADTASISKIVCSAPTANGGQSVEVMYSGSPYNYTWQTQEYTGQNTTNGPAGQRHGIMTIGVKDSNGNTLFSGVSQVGDADNQNIVVTATDSTIYQIEPPLSGMCAGGCLRSILELTIPNGTNTSTASLVEVKAGWDEAQGFVQNQFMSISGMSCSSSMGSSDELRAAMQ